MNQCFENPLNFRRTKVQALLCLSLFALLFSSCGIALEREMSRFRNYGLATLDYVDKHGEFPFQVDDKISWRAKILPFLAARDPSVSLSGALDLDQAWDSPANVEFASAMPKVFGADGQRTDLCWVVMDDPAQQPKRHEDLKGGSSNCIMMLKNPNRVPWLEPKDISQSEAFKLIKGLKSGQQIIAVLYDGHVMRLTSEISDDALRTMLDPNESL
jgi:hypothetical protein